MELTKEHFDKGISDIKMQISSVDSRVTNIEDKLVGIEDKMVTKDDLKLALNAQTLELQDYVHKSFEVQQDYMDERFKEMIVTYDTRERVSILEKSLAQIKLER